MKVTAFNVGQGDSFLLKGGHRCTFRNTALLIDCGYKSMKVFDKFDNKEISVLLTHSHRDHIGGFPDVLKKKNVVDIYIPFYMPEIMNIAKYLRDAGKGAKLGGIDWGKLSKFTPSSLDYVSIKTLARAHNLYFLYEGNNVCNHIEILNPPIDPIKHFPETHDSEEISIEVALEGLGELGLQLPVDTIINYESEFDIGLPPDLDLPTEEDSNDPLTYSTLAKRHVQLFFKTLYGRALRELMPLKETVASHLELTANQASIVLKYTDSSDPIESSWLFTGDADQYVFDRIIDEKRFSLKADYLKVPHHGSSENLSRRILKEISPNVAFVSHNNRVFGRSKDAHPHPAVVAMLDADPRITTYYTNDVIKKKVVVKTKTAGSSHCKKIDFK